MSFGQVITDYPTLTHAFIILQILRLLMHPFGVLFCLCAKLISTVDADWPMTDLCTHLTHMIIIPQIRLVLFHSMQFYVVKTYLIYLIILNLTGDSAPSMCWANK